MKTNTVLLLALFSTSIAPAIADILYVNNDTAYPADYRTFNDAFAAAAAGDTIMLAASTTSYGDIHIFGKPVKVVGNKSQNVNAPGQPVRADEMVTQVGFVYVGSDGEIGWGSLGDGVTEDRLLSNGTIIESLVASEDINLASNQCVIRRCRAADRIDVAGSSNLITQCDLQTVELSSFTNSTVTPTHVAPGTGNLFENCYVYGVPQPLLRTGSFTSGTFKNCVIGISGSGTLNKSYAIATTSTLILRSCILADTAIGIVKTTFNEGATRLHHCLLVGSSGVDKIPSQSSGLSNLTEANPAVVFGDDYYNLAVGSPAIGTGENGVDMGIYGGPTPYEYGGSPALPLINKLNILEANPTTGLTFQIEAEARD